MSDMQKISWYKSHHRDTEDTESLVVSGKIRQDLVSAAHVMVVGCGALGNEVLKNLVLMGVTHIVAVDFDIVEMGNLTRSVLFTRSDAERKRTKVEVVAERVRDMNPNIDIQTVCGDIAYDVGLGLIRQMDVVIGCVDSRWARFCINRYCMRAGIPWVDGGIDGLEGTVRVFAPGKNCYACNLGPEGLKDLARRMPCSGIIRRQEQRGAAPTTSIIASIIGAIEVQEALKIMHNEECIMHNKMHNEECIMHNKMYNEECIMHNKMYNEECIMHNNKREMTTLCGKMMYYDGEHVTVRIADFQAYDEECPEHETWAPVRQTEVSRDMTVAKALALLRQGDKETGRQGDRKTGRQEVQNIAICLTNDCFVDYVVRRDTDERIAVMVPGRMVADKVALEKALDGQPLSGLYQHEYHRVDASFPYPSLTLAQLGIPQQDIVRVNVDGEDYYLELSHGGTRNDTEEEIDTE
jgi:adenylyltransferase/sulfurtransferase